MFSNGPVVDHGDILILSVKPQVVPKVLPELKDSKKLLISIAMGIPLASLEEVIYSVVKKRYPLIAGRGLMSELFTKENAPSRYNEGSRFRLFQEEHP